MACADCQGTGVRDPAATACRLRVPSGWRVIEKCHTCHRYKDDLSAARAVARQVRPVTCTLGHIHAIGVGHRQE
jgi:hypothetical protein